MLSHQLYPVFLSLDHANCLIVGIGCVGQRKLRGLLSAHPANILVLDIKKFDNLDEDAKLLLRGDNIEYQTRRCEREDIKNSFLVFAATSNYEENSRISAMCKEENTLCNAVTNPENGTFIVPAQVKKGSLCAAISTGGASPGLGKNLCMEVEKLLMAKTALANFLGQLRPLAMEAFPEQKNNEFFFRELISSSFGQWLNDGHIEQCQQWLYKRLPKQFHPRVAKILNRN